MSIENKVVVITGAAGNLGRCAAAAFADSGARRILLDVESHGLEQAYGKDSDRQVLVTADLSDAAAVATAIEKGIARFGRIDVLCNLAGGFRMGPAVHETPADVWRLMLDLNAMSIINTARAVVPAMRAGGGGKIINVAATAGLHGRAAMGAYCAAKAAVIRLTESMAAELREQGINVNCVAPSILDTPQNRADIPDADPAKWVALDALVDVIRFLASDGARAIHGVTVPVVGLS